jgi:steroid 5-alpha reductase family enzyme
MALDPSRPTSWLTLLAPAAMYLVLRFITGVPPLEATMLASRGEAFRAYQRRTSAFIPLPPKDA